MLFIAQILMLIVALLHCLFFKLESLDFMKPKVLKRFGLDASSGEIAKIWAFNQGFYNLFLAFGLFFALYLFQVERIIEAQILAYFILWTIVGAGAVLFISSRNSRVAAMIQGLPALLGIVCLYFV